MLQGRPGLPHPRFRGGMPSSASPYKGEEEATLLSQFACFDCPACLSEAKGMKARGHYCESRNPESL